MAFLQVADYTNISTAELNDITGGSALIREDAERRAQAMIEDYLNTRYLTEQIFIDYSGATPDPRHQSIVKYMVDISLYLLFQRLAFDQMPQHRQIAYDNAIDWLKDVSRQRISPALPQPDNDSLEEVKYGSNNKRITRF